MTYSIIGSGNMAAFLARRLTTAGHYCTGIYARNAIQGEQIANSVNAVFSPLTPFLPDGEADICFLAVSDQAIALVAPTLHFNKTILVHTSGSVALNAIAVAAKDYAVFWPVYSIVKNHLPNHRSIPCAWYASSPQAQKHLLTIAHSISDVVFEAGDAQRQKLHLSAVICNNFTTHLMAVCEAICAEQQLPFSILQPIIEQTFDRIKKESPKQIQTGPARRHDSNTLQQHQQLLMNHPDWQAIYKVISTSIENMYKTD